MSHIPKSKISFSRETSSDHTPQSVSHRFSPAKSSPFSNKSPFSFTGSLSSSRVFLSNPVSPNGKRADTIITDVNDVSQVGKALGSVQSVKGRIQLLDQIIKKRQEIKDAEDELKLERVTPVIQKLTTNFKKRIRKAKSNDGKFSFQKTLLSLINEEDSPLKPPKDGAMQLKSPKDLSKSDVPQSRKVSLLCVPSKKDALTSSIKLDPLSSNVSTLMDLAIKPSQSEGMIPEHQLFSSKKQNGTLAQILGAPVANKKTKSRVALLLKQTAVDMTKSELPLLNDEKKETKGNKLSSRRRKSIANSLKQAKQEIEKDLYHHLVNKDSDSTAGNILSLKSKNGSIGNIDSRVKVKYENHINLKEKSDPNYFVPISFIPRKSSLGYVSPVADDDEMRIPKQKPLNSYRANATVRHINYDIFAAPVDTTMTTTMTSMMKNSRVIENSTRPNDSFASRLETQLEDFYNKQSAKEVGLTLGYSKSHGVPSKFQTTKAAKFQVIRNNSSDITRVSHPQKKLLIA